LCSLWLEVEAPLKELGRRLVHDDGVGFGAVDELVQRVEDVPPVRRVHPGDVATVRDQASPGVNGEPGLDALCRGMRALDGLQHGEDGMGGARSGVLHRLEPEHRHHTDGGQLLDPRAEALQLLKILEQRAA
jgi:hypothetical protein